MVRYQFYEGTHVIDWLSREKRLETQNDIDHESYLHASHGKWETDSRCFVVDLTTKDGDPSIASFMNILPQRLLDEVSVDADTPRRSVWREAGGSSVDTILEGGIRGSTETFQSVRS